MNLRELLIKIGVDDSGTVEKLDKVDHAADRAKSSIMSLGNVLAGLGIGYLVTQLTQLADSMQNLQSRIDAAAGGHIDGLFESLSEHATKAGMDVEAYADSWAKFGSGMRELGYPTAATTTLTDTLSAAFRLNGTAAETAAGALFQLTQSISSGSVQMEELNSFMDASPDLYRAVAKSIGGTTVAFKKMVSDGKVSSKMLADAIIAQNARIMKEVDKMPKTLGFVWNRIRNDAKTTFKQMFVDTNVLSGAAQKLWDMWDGVVGVWKEFTAAVGGSANVAKILLDMVTPLALVGAGFALIAALTSPIFLTVGAVMALGIAVGALYNDYKTWAAGGESLFDWKTFNDDIKRTWDSVTGLATGFLDLAQGAATWAAQGAGIKGWFDGFNITLKDCVEALSSINQIAKGIMTGNLSDITSGVQRLTAVATGNPVDEKQQPQNNAETAGWFASASDAIGAKISEWFGNNPDKKDTRRHDGTDVPTATQEDPNGRGATVTPSVTVTPQVEAPAPIEPLVYQNPLPPQGAGAIAPVQQVTNNNTDSRTYTSTSNPTFNVTVPAGTDGKQFAADAYQEWQQRAAQSARDMGGAN